jgi:hypothetical protein
VNIGASSGPAGGYGPDQVQSQEIGLVNAFTMVNNLVNNSTGQAGSASSGVTTYNAKINAIANTLAACVNTDPSTTTVCSSLMTEATVGGLVPKDTIQAAYMMAHNPATNAAQLLALATPNNPFNPSLASTTANLDLTLEVAFAPTYGAASPFSGASAVFNAQQIAIDENGRAWVVNQSGSSNGGGLTAPFVSGIGADGQVFAGPFQSFTVNAGFGVTDLVNPCKVTTHTLITAGYQVAIDQAGELWIPNPGDPATICGEAPNARTILRVNTKTAAADNGYWAYGFFGAMTVDGSGNVWFEGSGTHVEEFQQGQPTLFAQSAAVLGIQPAGAAVDSFGNIWLDQNNCTVGTTTSAAGVLFQVTNSGTGAPPVVQNGFYGSGNSACTGGSQTTVANPGVVTGIATDANAGIWVASETPSAMTYFAPQSNAWATAVAGNTSIPVMGAQTATTGNLNNPVSIAVDGSNNAWVVGNAYNTGVFGDSLAEYSVSLSSGTGNIAAINPLADYVFPSTGSPFPRSEHSVAIDPSGNLWIASGSTSTSWVTVVVGLATPVVTPLALQAEYNLIGAMATPTLTVSTNSVSYPTTAAGASTAQTVTLSDAYTAALSVLPTISGSDPADFTITGNTCGGSVAPLGTCTLTVSFTPLGTGIRTANLAIANNGAVSPLLITLTGTGTAGTAPVAPVFSPAAGTYTDVQTITINDAAYGATLYYTTDGTTPSPSSLVYKQPFQLNTSAVVKVLVVAPNYTANTTGSAMYTINTSGATILATATANPGGTQIAVGPSFLGFSEVLSDVPLLYGTSSGTVGTSTVNPIFLQMVTNLAQYSSGPFLFRILNDQPFSSLTYGPAATLSTMSAFYNAMNKANTPHGVQFWVGLNLNTAFTTTDQGCGSAPDNSDHLTVYADCGVATSYNESASDAQTAASTLPSGSLIGFELGNEPDLYASTVTPRLVNSIPWNYSSFDASYDSLVDGVKGIQSSVSTTNLPQGSSALPVGNNGAIMAGPVFADFAGAFGPNLPSFISSEQSNLTMVNLHYYGGIQTATSQNALDYLLTDAALNFSTQYASPSFLSSNGIVADAHSAVNAAGQHPTLRIGEINSIANGGQAGVSDRFGSALWLLDESMKFAQAGVDGVNYFGRGCPGIGRYSPFCFNNTGSYPNLTYSLGYVGPEYYGMLLTQQLLQNSAALLPLTLNVSGTFTVSGYATRDAGGTMRVLLINKTEGTGGDIQLTVTGRQSTASLTYLLATGNNYQASDYTSTVGANSPISNTPTDEITIGGQTFKGSTDGTLQGTQSLVAVAPVGSMYTISMPPVSAVLVTIP